MRGASSCQPSSPCLRQELSAKLDEAPDRSSAGQPEDLSSLKGLEQLSAVRFVGCLSFISLHTSSTDFVLEAILAHVRVPKSHATDLKHTDLSLFPVCRHSCIAKDGTADLEAVTWGSVWVPSLEGTGRSERWMLFLEDSCAAHLLSARVCSHWSTFRIVNGTFA